MLFEVPMPLSLIWLSCAPITLTERINMFLSRLVYMQVQSRFFYYILLFCCTAWSLVNTWSLCQLKPQCAKRIWIVLPCLMARPEPGFIQIGWFAISISWGVDSVSARQLTRDITNILYWESLYKQFTRYPKLMQQFCPGPFQTETARRLHLKTYYFKVVFNKVLYVAHVLFLLSKHLFLVYFLIIIIFIPRIYTFTRQFIYTIFLLFLIWM